ncbi:filamentous hemagglutinin [Bartonella tribocorum]|uniref:Toxin CdiA n=2 Tax=Bartonella tribocorum TaxID=85701 RepID=A9IV93_BART1|nr:hypothetical protein BT_1293 [Bartonella tribocorum CIP 105476]CDO48903.1 filamentous hemagglutinin [Bartonella tribocorum]
MTTKDQDFKDTYQRNENLVWWSERDKGYLNETIEHVTIEAGGGMKLDAGNGFVVEYETTGDFDKSLEQLARSPGLSWIKQLRDDPELAKQVDWQAVKAEFKDWDYKAQGLTEAGAALVALAVTAVTGGAASTAANAITGALGLGSSTAMNAAIQAGVQALINKSAVALANNRGNIAGALHELGSSKNILGIVSAMLTAGLTSQITEMAGVGQSLPKTAPLVDRITREAEKNLIKAAIGTGVQTALEGGSLDKNFFNNLRIALSDTVGKSLAEEIGTAKAEGKIDTVTQIVAHAGLGCLKGAVASGACSAGAIGGAVGEATAMLQFKLWMQSIVKEEMGDLNGRTPTAEEQARITAKIDAQFADFRNHTIDVARAAGGFAAALAGGNVDAGADAAGNAAANNFLSSAQRAQMKKELEECSDKWCRKDVAEKWLEIDDQQDVFLTVGTMSDFIADIPMSLYEFADGAVKNIMLKIIIAASNPWGSGKTTLNDVGTAMSWAESGHVIDDVWEGADQFLGGVQDSFIGHIDHIKENFEKAGVDGAFNAGFESGRLLAGGLETFVGGAGAVKGGVKLGESALIKFMMRKDFAQFASKKNLLELAAQGDPAKLSVKKELTNLAAQEKKNWLKEKPIKFTDSKFGQTNKVYQRNDLFDPNRVSDWEEKGKTVWGTNIERMETGRAPIGFDNKSVELHHLKQTPEGPIAEMSHESHKKYTSVIHNNPQKHQSLIERKKFDKWREEYWKERAKGYREQKNSNLGGIIDMRWGIIGIDFDRWGQEHRQ